MKLTALILASAFAMAGTASADVTNPEDGITYNYLTAEWIRLDPDGGSASDGGGIILSYSPSDHIYLTGGGAFVDNFSRYNVGVGGFYALMPNLHIAGDIGALWADAPGTSSDTGFYVNPHLRWKPIPKLEIHAGATWADVNNDEQWTGYGRVFFEIFPAVDLTGCFSANSDWQSVSAGVRLRF